MPPHDPQPQKVSDSLIQRAIQRDESACVEIVEITYPTLISIIRRNLARSECAEDLAQEVFVKIFQNLHQFRGDRPFENWASRITTLTCYDALRRQKRRPQLQYSDLPADQCAALSAVVEPDQASHDTQVASRELVDQLLATLKPRDELVIRLLYLEDRSVAEISEETGWSTSKVKVTAMRARQKLKKTLQRLETTRPQLSHETSLPARHPLGQAPEDCSIGLEGASA